MKKLKFDHHESNLIRSGEKTSSWRVYDDKNISVNDEVELVDKVDPGNPSTWVEIGVGHVDTILEKRFRDVRPDDFVGQEPHHSAEEMLEHFQKYYGPQVDLDTPVKMIHFHLKTDNVAKKLVVPKTTKLVEAKMYADGGSRGNPGPSASGFVVLTMDDEVVARKGIYLGITTNNQAEYQALRSGLQEAQRMGIRKVHVYMDSMLVVNQMLGIFKVKNRDLWPIHDSIKQVAATFEHVSYTHVPRELNKLADREVNRALDAASKNHKVQM